MIRVALGFALVLSACSSQYEHSVPSASPDALGMQLQGVRVVEQVLPTPLPRRVTRIVLTPDIDLPLVSSSQIDAVPEGAAFVMEGTSWPCNPGTSYVYSHARAGMFLSLWNVRVADVVEFRDGAGVVCSYSVTKMVRVSADDTSWFTYSTGPSTLILQTSLGPNPAYGEFIVVAERSNP